MIEFLHYLQKPLQLSKAVAASVDNEETQSFTSDSAQSTSHDDIQEDAAQDSDFDKINPDSEEARVNEKLKKEHSSFMFGKGTTQMKVLLAMIFGMLTYQISLPITLSFV